MMECFVSTAYPKLQKVQAIPLASLSRDGVVLQAVRKRHIGKEDIRQLLRDEGVDMVVADVGQPLAWSEKAHRFTFWKDEVQQRLVPPDAERWNLDEFPGLYCYQASEWQVGPSQTVILLEKYH